MSYVTEEKLAELLKNYSAASITALRNLALAESKKESEDAYNFAKKGWFLYMALAYLCVTNNETDESILETIWKFIPNKLQEKTANGFAAEIESFCKNVLDWNNDVWKEVAAEAKKDQGSKTANPVQEEDDEDDDHEMDDVLEFTQPSKQSPNSGSSRSNTAISTTTSGRTTSGRLDKQIKDTEDAIKRIMGAPEDNKTKPKEPYELGTHKSSGSNSQSYRIDTPDGLDFGD